MHYRIPLFGYQTLKRSNMQTFISFYCYQFSCLRVSHFKCRSSPKNFSSHADLWSSSSLSFCTIRFVWLKNGSITVLILLWVHLCVIISVFVFFFSQRFKLISCWKLIQIKQVLSSCVQLILSPKIENSLSLLENWWCYLSSIPHKHISSVHSWSTPFLFFRKQYMALFSSFLPMHLKTQRKN